ncbi:MAG: YncE family protein, partial [Terriglobales bacterium]
MQKACVVLVLIVALLAMSTPALAQQSSSTGPYKVLKTVKAGGEGGFDYIFADVKGRRLYVPRGAPTGLMVFNLDTLESVGTIADAHAGGATVDPKSHHGFSTTKPITMWDSQTLKVIKTIDVDGRP